MATTLSHTGTGVIAAARRGAAVVCDAPVALFVEVFAFTASLPPGVHVIFGLVALAIDMALSAERR